MRKFLEHAGIEDTESIENASRLIDFLLERKGKS